MKWYMGIDPGITGGIAAISDTGLHIAQGMPETASDIATCFEVYTEGDVTAYIERVSSSPQMGVKSAFTFGHIYGMLRMALVAYKIPYTEVAPGVWQRVMGCLSKGDKNVTKNRAQQLFPKLRITHKTADALLIAEFGRRKEVGL